MMHALSSAVLAWLLTYLIHSTALLSLAWALTRWRSWPAAATDLLWKTALVGGLATASLQLALELRPAGSVSLTDSGTVAATVVAPHAPAEEHLASAKAPDVDIPAAAVMPSSAVGAPAPAVPVATLVALGWALGALVLALTYAGRRLILVGRIGDRVPVRDGRLLAELETLAREANLRRRPSLTFTTRISSPIALGVREICIPESALTELDLEQQRVMLAHELAHLARRDPLWLAFASLVERVLWIQPLNRLARRGITTSAEYLCDEWAVRRTGSGMALARCLAQVAEWVQASPLGVPVAGMAEERSLLVSRVEKLLAGRTSDSRSRRLVALGSALVVLATIAVVPGVTGRAARASTALGIPDDPPPASSARGASVSDAEGPERERDVPPFRTAANPDVQPHGAAADSEVVLALIGRLKDESAEVRAAAAQSLGKLEDSRAVPALVAALADREARVRAAAAESLGRFSDQRALSGLTALLADPELEVRKHALEALTEYESGVPAAPIVRLLGETDAELRHSAAHALGRIGDRSAGAALAPLVKDPSPEVRQAAIEAIGELRDLAHASSILPALNDPSSEVRERALEALSDLRTPIPDATLLALLRDANADVRAKAAEVAGERNTTAAIPVLRRMLDDPDGDVRERAVSALSEFAGDAAIDALRAALGSKDAEVRRAAAEALGERRQ